VWRSGPIALVGEQLVEVGTEATGRVEDPLPSVVDDLVGRELLHVSFAIAISPVISAVQET
jgi:hypothetical protein